MAFDFEKLSVLVVEDLLPMRRLMISILDTLGVGDVYSAEEGQQGFEVFCRKSPDIVITDWSMIPLNGLELARRIRMSPKSPNKMVPIIMVSGYSAMKRVQESRDSGVTEFLAKPFCARDMAQRIAHVIKSPRDFIDSDEFFGPDRRRKRSEDYQGPQRRDEDHVFEI